MAGYDGFSMSINAVDAYERGLRPASQVDSRLSARLVEKFCTAAEWHHSSKNFNRVNFYDVAEVLATFGLAVHEDYPADPAAVAALAAPKVETVIDACTVRWLDWSGTKKHPKATERSAENCRVSVGATATVTLPDGSCFQKRVTTRGFRFGGT
jgi:hypothetical protein